MKNVFVKKFYLICLLLSAFPVLFLNFSLPVFYFSSKASLLGQDWIQVLPLLGRVNDTALVGLISLLLFLYVVIHFHYRKTNLLWLLVPVAGTMIFSITKLFEKDTIHENY